MIKKILFCASTISHIKNFHLPYLQVFQEQGYEVWVATNQDNSIPYADHMVALSFDKKLFSLQNIRTIFRIKKLLKEQNFDIVSIHTTLASAVVRAAVLLLHRKPKVFCTVHGYLFSENSGLKKWIYLLPEKLCSHVTDVLMVMNHEDYDIAQKHKLYRGKLYYINGMGIDLDKFRRASEEKKFSLKQEMGMKDDDFLFVYAAEFSKRKNQRVLIQAFADVCKEYPGMKLLLAGHGVLLESCKELVQKLHMEKRILFLGHVSNISELYSICNVCVTTSLSEGLPFNVMEAMACGLPVIASNIKGHRELVDDGKTGILFRIENQTELEEALKEVFCNTKKQIDFGLNAVKNINQFGIDQVSQEIIKIYRTNMQER